MLQIWQLTPIMAALRRLREEEDWRIELQVSLGYTARLFFLRKRKTNNYCIKVFEDIWIIVKRENQSIKFRECTVPWLDVHTRTPCQTLSLVPLEARGPLLSLLSLEQVLSGTRLHGHGFHTEIKPEAQFGGVKGSWEKLVSLFKRQTHWMGES